MLKPRSVKTLRSIAAYKIETGKCKGIMSKMKKQEWQSLYDELAMLNEEFNLKNNYKKQIRNKAQLEQLQNQLAYITEMAFARITSNTEAYSLFTDGLYDDNELIALKLSILTDSMCFSDTLAEYLERVKEKL